MGWILQEEREKKNREFPLSSVTSPFWMMRMPGDLSESMLFSLASNLVKLRTPWTTVE
jgi:hypothetical protein